MPNQANRNPKSGQALKATLEWCEGQPKRALTLLCLLFFLPGFFTLPPLDRDESRFVQATKQMVETGDFIEIRFQDEARNKKPVGIYWLQALPASLLAGPDHNKVWAYRLPSLFAALAAVLLTLALGTLAFDRRTGFIGGLLMASTTLLVVESGIAKTDATLLAVTLWGLYALAQLYLASQRPDAAKVSALTAYGFWAALGLGLLIKGPVVALVLGMTALSLSLWDRSFVWLKTLRLFSGPFVTVLIALPWFIAIYYATDGAFYAEALGDDFGGKLVSGQESHGAPPGLYALIVWLTFWPASLLLLPMLPWAFAQKSDPAVRFMICWALPTWIVMELIPTKLPHYTLALYPALAILVAAMLVKTVSGSRIAGRAKLAQSWIGRIGLLAWLLPAFVFAAAIALLPVTYGEGLEPMLVAGSVLTVALALSVAVFFWRGRLLLATSAACLTGLFVFAVLFEGTMSALPALKLSPRLHQTLERHGFEDDASVGILGYSEPSFIFLNGTKTRLLGSSETVPFLQEGPGRAILVEVRKDGAFQDAVMAAGLSVEALDEVKGYNYSKGREVTLTLYRLASFPKSEPQDE